ncbi:MAG: ArsC family transcriptional regulator [Sedimentibacter sp.]|jgi:arsenate reductase|nr:ArsC family transcriptional regulator [Sedimentibacter sp.]
MNNNKPKVAFICVHNSCRSQIAEALGKHFASDVFESYSGGTETKPHINQDAVRLMKKFYDIDMEKTQYSKLITELPEIDIKITMGCNVICPFVDSKYEEDWGLDDPTGKSDEEFEIVITEIEKKVKELADKISNQKLY